MRHFELFCSGVFVHIVLLLAIFDVYYKSPISHGINPVKIRAKPPASRLVLFVADGLRAQSFYEPHPTTGKYLAPFLRNIIKTKGSWGVSHTHVPTESRPGHVALIAGFYEDVSAVAKGWKENPVEFDSVFNQSTFTWSWGSPDILPMFARGPSADHVFTFMYPGSSEDFASEDASKLDTWVFDSVKDFFTATKSNQTLTQMLSQEGTIFFLHLLGIDTNGHGNKPRSKEYLNNIALVDKGVEEITQIMESFFSDKRTAYIFTADHGMTDWGSHGAGDNEETMTPLVAWGSGVAGPTNKASSKTSANSSSIESILWGLSDLKRKDVSQADLAPLMSTLVGIPIPVNSVGTLPAKYLNTSEKYLYQAACANFQQILLQFKEKRLDKQTHSFRILFREFSKLRPKKLSLLESEIEKLARQRRFITAAELCLESIPNLLAGVQYYHQYERTFLTAAIVGIFVSWMSLVWVVAKSPGGINSEKSDFLPNLTAKISLAAVALCLWLQNLPFSYYIYCCLPIYLTNLTWNATRKNVTLKMPKILTFCSEISLVVTAGSLIFVAFFYRWALSLGLLVLAFCPFFLPDFRCSEKNQMLKIAWGSLCLLNAVFPLLPTVGQASDVWVVILAPFGCVICIGLVLLKKNLARKTTGELLFFCNKDSAIFMLLGVSLGISAMVVMLTDVSIASKMGLPFLCQVWSWSMLFLGPVLPLMSSTMVESRLAAICLGLFSPYTLMSVSHEALFFISFMGLLITWLKLESSQLSEDTSLKNLRFEDLIPTVSKSPLETKDWRQAFFFLFFVLLSFFGTGNIASLNSFNPSFTRCFSTVFRPFVMGGLLIGKILIPFLLVSVSLCALEQITGRKAKDLMLLVLIYSDFTAMVFFFVLKDEGSWLEIGTSISHYAISMLITIFLLLLYQLASVITRVSLADILFSKTHIL